MTWPEAITAGSIPRQQIRPGKVLKRYLVVIRLGRRGALRWRGASARAAGPTARSLLRLLTTAAAGTATEHLHHLADHFEFTPLLARLLVIPGIELEPAFDENRAAFLEIFARHLGSATPKGHVDKGDFFTLLAVIERVLAIDRNPEISDRAAFRRVAHFRVAGQVAEEENFIVAGHAPLLPKL